MLMFAAGIIVFLIICGAIGLAISLLFLFFLFVMPYIWKSLLFAAVMTWIWRLLCGKRILRA